MQENQFCKAVREWLSELEDMPTFRTGTCRYGAKQNKAMCEGVVNGLVRDIVRSGLRFFYEVSEECRTYGDLQRKLSREWLANEAGKTRKQAQKQRVKKANENFDGWATPLASPAASTTSPDLSSQSLGECGSPFHPEGPASEGESTQGSMEHSDGDTSSAPAQRKVTFVFPGSWVTAHDVRLAPSLHNVKGRLVERTNNNRLVIQFPPPHNKMSLRPCNVIINE